jgi:hypothetical protein
MADWNHTAIEKDLIREFGGEPTESFGPDGTLGGDPVEVRLAREEDRFRVNRDTHEILVDEGGSYLFDDLEDNQPPTEVSAGVVDDLLGGGDWHSDRGYEHRFVDVDEIF